MLHAAQTEKSMLTAPDPQYPITDVQLSRRLEGTEAAANVAFVEARARLDPASGATHARIAGVSAMFDGRESPLTQTFGLGVCGMPSAAEFDILENFFTRLSAPVYHEVSPVAPPEVLGVLVERGYVPVELSTVLVRPTIAPVVDSPRVSVRRIRPEEGPLWSRTAAEGWGSESDALATFVEAFGQIITEAGNVHCFLVEVEGRPVAAGALSISGNTALLAGASTIPDARRQGAQLALLAARLKYAASHGADLAMMVAQPGSASQRNAERQGFRTTYTRTKWHLRDSGA
jgi:GNAT superfamily N-acetyltransferase